MSFAHLGLSDELLNSIQEQGYQAPTPIQKQVIPAILLGKDIMASAQTGTGKTAGFTLPLLQRLSTNEPSHEKKKRPIRALILTPTRELAAQVREKVSIYSKYLNITSSVVFGGVSTHHQIIRLRKGVDVLVATPGRLLDLVNQRALNLSSVEILVLDEADRMLDMGFIHDVKKILGLMPKNRQNLLFSATISSDIKKLGDTLLKSPVLIKTQESKLSADTIQQVIHPVENSRKRELLSFIIGSQNWKQVLVFTRTKHGANRLSDQLQKDGLTSTAIHGDKSQGARSRALADFKRGKIRVLVATDVAARGLDINRLPHVINFNLPEVAEDYVHRIGRTGRANNAGMAISLVTAEENKLLKNIERFLKCELPQETIPGFEFTLPEKSSKPKARKRFHSKSKSRQTKKPRNRRRTRANTP